MHWRKGMGFLGFVAIAVVTIAMNTHGFSSGIMRPQLPDEGCTCHGPNGSNGVDSPNVQLLFQVEGGTYQYDIGQSYNLTVGAAASDVPASTNPALNKGGFNLRVSVGTLAPGPGFEEFVQVSATGREATHTKEGDANGRIFNLTWTAPPNAAEPAVFTLFVNTVNGNGANEEGDHFNRATFVILGESTALGGAADVSPEEAGVRWLAHWVGIISFVAVFAVLVLYYFVLKYGETVHTTDHRDRKEK